MIEFLCGLLGFVAALGIFLLGFHVGRKTTAPAPKELTDVEQERIRRERDRLEKEQAAFRALTGYSADIAYGVVEFPKEGLE